MERLVMGCLVLERFVCESPTRTPRTTSPTAGEMWRASSGRARRFTASSSLSQAMSGESGQILILFLPAPGTKFFTVSDPLLILIF